MPEYGDLLEVLGDVPMDGYCASNGRYIEWEREVATPKLLDLGYEVGPWMTGERDLFGPLSRVVQVCKDGVHSSLVYG